MKKLIAIGLCTAALTTSAGVIQDLIYSASNVVIGCACVVGNVVTGAFAGVTGSDQVVMDYALEPLYNRNVDPGLCPPPVVIRQDHATVQDTYIYVVEKGGRPPYQCGNKYRIGNNYISREKVTIIYE